MNKKAGKDTVIAILVAAILVMAAGYALLSSHLKITGGAGIGGNGKWDVAITNITEGTPTGSAINRMTVSINGNWSHNVDFFCCFNIITKYNG